MEKKNTILLTVIAIATLLVAVVGATFAYFTATVTPAKEDIKTDVTTDKLSGTNFTFNSNESEHNYLGYPGGLAVFGAKASVSKTDDEDSAHDYESTFNLQIAYTNNTQTNLEWTLYMLSSTDLNEGNLEEFKEGVDPKCQLNNKTVGTNTYYWYGSADGTDATNYESGMCTFSSEMDAFFDDAHAIASGILKKNTSEGKINKETQTVGGDGELESGDSYEENPLKGRKLDTKTNTEKYYYLVVAYPNSEDQSADAGSKINVTLSVDGDPESVLMSDS